jgi:uncharacterized RDD family membrane protein YckC
MKFDLQRGSLTKRMAAWLLDCMLLLVLVVGAASALTALLGYDTYQTQLSGAYEKYQVQYGIQFQITQEEYDALPAEQKQAYDDAYNALNEDDEAMYAYNMIVNLTMLITSGSIFLGVLIAEFVVPMFLKNGQTVGKKVFGLGVIRPDGVQLTGVQLFIRSILGKYAVEIMIPVYVILMLFFQTSGILGLALIAAVGLTQLGLLIFNRNKMLIHDLLASTVVVDLASHMIFESSEELIAYKNQLHAEEVSRQDY